MKARVTFRGLVPIGAAGDRALIPWGELSPAPQEAWGGFGQLDASGELVKQARWTYVNFSLRTMREDRVARRLWRRSMLRRWRAGTLVVEQRFKVSPRMQIWAMRGAVVFMLGFTAAGFVFFSRPFAPLPGHGTDWVAFVVGVLFCAHPMLLLVVLCRLAKGRIGYEAITHLRVDPSRLHATRADGRVHDLPWTALRRSRNAMDLEFIDGTRLRLPAQTRAAARLAIEQARLEHDGAGVEEERRGLRNVLVRVVLWFMLGGLIAWGGVTWAIGQGHIPAGSIQPGLAGLWIGFGVPLLLAIQAAIPRLMKDGWGFWRRKPGATPKARTLPVRSRRNG